MATKIRNSEDLNKELAIVCSWYSDSLTVDDVLNGLYSDELIDFIFGSCNQIINGTLEKLTEKKRPGGEGKKLTLPDFLKEMYFDLMHAGISMREIDEMDLDYYIEISDYHAEQQYWENVDSFANAPI